MKLARFILALMTMSAAANAAVTKSDFGKTNDGKPVDCYTLKNPHFEVQIITYGARVRVIKTPDAAGHLADVALGYPNLASYEADKTTYFGAIVGRYGNRIGKGRFTLEGKPYQITLNNNGNMLHGGVDGFDERVWTAQVKGDNAVEMSLVSPDGDQGFPGKLIAHVTYRIEGTSLHIDYSATTDKPTVLNLTNHTYFNLAGSGSILGEHITIYGSRITPVDSGLIPTGQLMPVQGTPFDFTVEHVIGERINAENQQIKYAKGYDHNWVLDVPPGQTGLHKAAMVFDPESGRTLTVLTTQPGVQFYTGNFLDGTKVGKNKDAYAFRSGLCLETQHFPDSPNHPNFPTTELKPGQTFHSQTVFEFSVRK